MAGKAMQTTQDLTLDDFDFDLPPELIAQHPLPDRAAGSRRCQRGGAAVFAAAGAERLAALDAARRRHQLTNAVPSSSSATPT